MRTIKRVLAVVLVLGVYAMIAAAVIAVFAVAIA